jgi:hypothetical protein
MALNLGEMRLRDLEFIINNSTQDTKKIKFTVAGIEPFYVTGKHSLSPRRESPTDGQDIIIVAGLVTTTDASMAKIPKYGEKAQVDVFENQDDTIPKYRYTINPGIAPIPSETAGWTTYYLDKATQS